MLHKMNYGKGVQDGVFIGVGYFSVSFSFGILAVKGGLGLFPTTLISMTNLTSAGQFAGLENIVAGSSILVVILTQMIINLRYALMSLSLSQKLDKNVGGFKRLVVAFFNTDEIFAVAIGQKEKLSFSYMLGLATLPWCGWTLGTFCGAYAGEILPVSISAALGVALYAMFIAIVVPEAKQKKEIRVVVILAILFSCVIYYFVPILKDLSIILCTILAAALASLLYPIKQK